MFDVVVDLLLPHFKTERQRESLLSIAFSDQYRLPYKIDYSGSAIEFTPRLIYILQEHGEVTPGMQALWRLLLTLNEHVGDKHQKQISNMLTWANSPHAVTTRYVPFMVEALPVDFVPRPNEFRAIVETLLAAKSSTVAITAALKGAGGYGKTTLARAVCHNQEIKNAFADGILWVTVGEKISESDLVAKVLNLVVILTNERPPVTDIESAKTKLKEAVGDSTLLLVVDDVWSSNHIAPFLSLGGHIVVLITTRNSGTLPRNTITHNVDAMQIPEALQLLSADLEISSEETRKLRDLSARLGEWPLLLKLANRSLRERLNLGQVSSAALDWIDKALSRKGFKALNNPHDPDERHAAAHATLDVSLSLLIHEQRDLYDRLAIFAEDIDIPLATLEKLWGINDLDTEDLCLRLMSLSLLLRYDLRTKTIRLHDVVRADLRDENQAKLVEWNDSFLEKYGISRWHELSLDEPYLWRWLAYHLREAAKLQTLRNTLLDYQYLQAKLRATDVNALIADSDLLGEDTAIYLIRSAITLSKHILEQDKKTLAHQIVGRLMEHRQITDIRTLTDDIQAQLLRLYAVSLDGNSTHISAGGVLLRILSGHTDAVFGALELRDGRLLSWSSDQTLRLWDLDRSVLRILEGHKQAVIGALELRDGRLLSWSSDQTLRLWNADGSELGTFEGYRDSVAGVIELSGNRLLSWSMDRTLRLWNIDGSMLRVLEGHSEAVTGVLELRDGRLLSWSRDRTLRLRDKEGNVLKEQEGHREAVSGALELRDGRLLSWSRDRTLRLWNIDGSMLRVLEGHREAVSGALELRDGRLLSWSRDRTLRLWNIDGSMLRVLEGHREAVSGALELRDGRLLSWSGDQTLRLWNVDGSMLRVLEGYRDVIAGALELRDSQLLSWNNDRTLRLCNVDGGVLREQEGHRESVTGIIELRDGRLLTWSIDRTLRLWGAEGSALKVLEGHTAAINGALELRDGRLLTWSIDRTLRLWGAEGSALKVLEGHTAAINGALASRDGRLLSWGDDRTLRLWNEDTNVSRMLVDRTNTVKQALELFDGRLLSWGGELDYTINNRTLRLWNIGGQVTRVLEGHSDIVTGALELKDGRLLSWSHDRTLRLWNADGRALRVLEGHSSVITGALELKDGRLLSWSHDRTLRLWNADGRVLRVLEGHTATITGVIELSDSRLLTWAGESKDRKREQLLWLWNADGRVLRVLEGHTATIIGAIELKDKKILSWAQDSTLRIWSCDTGELLDVFYGDVPFTYCTFLKNETIVAGDEQGHVIFLRFNFPPD